MARKPRVLNALPAGSLDDGLATETVAEEVVAEEVTDGDLGTEEPAKPKAKKPRKKAKTKEEAPGFLGEQAAEDREGAKAKHVDDGLEAVSEMVTRMARGLAYAKLVHEIDVKLSVLSEIADTAAAVTDDARRAVRNANTERRNLQPSRKQ